MPGTAIAGSDYQTASTTLTFSAGQTSKTFQVKIVNDRKAEPTEQFTVVLSNAVGATIADGTGVVTILDNDSALVASRAAPDPITAATAEPEAITSALDAARAVWVRAGYDVSGLQAVTVSPVDLPGATLAQADGDVIRLDPNAAGWGWTTSGDRIDLVTVLTHELGHLLGLDHADAHVYAVMGETLRPTPAPHAIDVRLLFTNRSAGRTAYTGGATGLSCVLRGYNDAMSGMEDRARGKGSELTGKAKETAGRATGDPELRARGEADQAKGKAQGLLGRFKTFLARR